MRTRSPSSQKEESTILKARILSSMESVAASGTCDMYTSRVTLWAAVPV